MSNPTKSTLQKKLDRTIICLLLIVVNSLGCIIHAQGYIECATMLNDAEGFSNGDIEAKTVNGYTYLMVSPYYDFPTDARFPIVNGEPSVMGDFTGEIYFAIFDPNCNQIKGTYINGVGEFGGVYGVDLMVDEAGNAYVLGLMYSITSIPTTDGTTINGADPYVLHKYAPDGTLSFSTVYGGTTGRTLDGYVTSDGTDTYVTGHVTPSSDFPTTDGTTMTGGNEQFLVKYDGAGNLIYATLIGGTGSESAEGIVASNGCATVVGYTLSADFPTTDGTSYNGSLDVTLTKYDPVGNLVFSTIFGGSGSDRFFNSTYIETDGTYIYIYGRTGSTDFPTTDGTVPSSGTDSDVYVLKYDMAGNLIFSTVFGGTGGDKPEDIVLQGGDIYLSGTYANGDFPVTVGQVSSPNGGAFLVRMDDSGNIIYATTYGTVTGGLDGIFVDPSGSVYLPVVGSTGGVATDNEKESQGSYIAKFNPDGTLCSSTFINNERFGDNDMSCPEVIGDTLYFLSSASGGGRTTDGTVYSSNEDFLLTKFVFCPEPSPITVDTLSSPLITVCENGIIEKIDGLALTIDGSLFPQIFDNGTATTQSDIPLEYQWQVSPTGSGPWTDIPGPLAQQQDYTPSPTTSDLYYRRQTKTSECCGGTLASTSTITHVQVSSNVAPVVEAGEVSYTCPGSPVTIDATVVGGTAPFTYDWNDGAYTIEDPTVSPIQSTVYTLEVTDANGCVQSGQTTVVTYEAEAGTATNVCSGAGTTIGGTPLPGVPIVPTSGTPPAGEHSIEYAWSPSTGLSCTDCPNPTATPSAAETYTLTVTINYPDGTSCQTTDMVEVGVIDGPTTEFAGLDTVLCLGETAVLGLAPEGVGGPYFAQAAGSTTTSGTLIVSQLSDGSTSTGVKTNDGNTQNVVLNLGSVFEVNILNLAILNSSSSDSDFSIEVSTDGVNYTTLFSDVRTSFSAQTRVSSSSPTTLSFPTQDVQYFRFTSESSSRDVGIGEFSVSLESYNYIWTPGVYINTNDSYATYDAGTLEMPSNNPITYTVTANQETCNFFDQVTVAVIEARAGEDGCGPRFLGEIDRTPAIEETYSWVKIADPSITTGTGDLLTSTDILHTSVSASEGGSVGYELTVSYTLPSGVTGICKDTIIVPPCIDVSCDVISDGPGCPDFDNGEPRLIGLPPNSDEPDLWTYSWDSDLGMTGLDSYNTQEVMLTDNVARTYTVTFTSTIDPTYTCIDTIVANSASYSTPIINAIGGTTCKGDSVNIGDPSNNPGLTYTWTSPEFLDDPTSNYPKAFPPSTTEFILTATDNVTGCIAMDTLTVVVPTAANAGEDLNVCDNGVVTIGANTDTLGYTYSWEPAGAAWEPGSGPTDAMPEVFVATTQDFYLTTVDTAGTCTTRDTVTVTVEALPPPFALSDIDYCPSQGSLTLGTADGTAGGTNEVPVGFLYTWKPNTVSDEFAQNPTVNTPLPTVPTTYTIIVATPGGCNQKATQTINPIMSPPLVGSSSTICLGESTPIGDDTNEAGFDYVWTSSDTDVSSTLDNAMSLNPSFTPDATGTFIFVVTKTSTSLSCSSTAQVKITVTELLAPTLTPQTICAGESIQIGIQNLSILQYQWEPTIGLDDPFISNPTFSGTTSTNYTLTTIDDNGCTAEASTSVTVNPPPAVTVSLPDTVLCDVNTSNVVLNPTVTPAGNYTYSWSPSDNLSSDDVLNPTFFVPSEGAYEYIFSLTDQTTGCTVTDTLNVVIEFFAPAPIISASTDTVCAGSDAMLSVSVSESNVNYQWQESITSCTSGFTDIPSATAEIYQASPTQEKYYRVIVFDANNYCSDTSSCITVSTVECIVYDWGDLPDTGAGTSIGNYETQEANTGPSHQIVAGLNIGSTVDEEADGQQSIDALADAEDEDGFNFPNTLDIVPGGILNLPIDVVNTTGTTAHYEVWIDWNGDGDFDDPNEMVADLSDDGAGDFGQTYFTVNIPADATTDQLLGFRARLSNTDNMTPYGQVDAGEVEDYLIEIKCKPNVCLPIDISIQRD